MNVRPRDRRDYARLALAVGRWALAVAATAAIGFLLVFVRAQDDTIDGLRMDADRDRAQQEQINRAVSGACSLYGQFGSWPRLAAERAAERAAATPGVTPTVDPAVAALGRAGDLAAEQAGCPSPSPSPSGGR